MMAEWDHTSTLSAFFSVLGCCRSAKAGATAILVEPNGSLVPTGAYCGSWMDGIRLHQLMTREIEMSLAMNISTGSPQLRAVLLRPPSTKCTSPG